MPVCFLTLILLQFWNCIPGDCQADPAENVKLRLVNGGSPCSGRLEIQYKGQWGTIYGSLWDLPDASVVCRELGCGIALAALYWAYFGEGSGPIITGNVQCGGSETALRECTSAAWDDYDLEHKYDAGVICADPRKFRLVNGSSPCAGRLEVYDSGSWRTICGHKSWSGPIGDRVCEELACGSRINVSFAAHFGKGSGPFIGPSECEHQHDIEVICSDHKILRLESGENRCSGRVDIQQGNTLGTLCDVYFDLEDAAVVCEHLQCGAVKAIPKRAHFGKGTAPFWKHKYMCRGNESRLWDCPISSWEQFSCSHGSAAGVICSGESWIPRLTNGGSRCDGTVEIYHNQRWGRVHDRLWDLNDANVVCRELGCGYAISAYDSSKYGESEQPLFVNSVHCKGNESQLRNCSLMTLTSFSNDSSGVGVLCSEHLKLRLSDGGSPCAGRVEVYYAGAWGSVCGDSWDMVDAGVVCRQLGCGTVVKTNRSGDCGESPGPIWLDEVTCSGNESFLWECPSAPWGKHDCAHKEDVMVMCSEHREIVLVNGDNRCEGRVEVFYNGSWGTVCSETLERIDAGVICKHLQCGALQSIRDDMQKFGPGTGPIWLDGVECMSHALTLWQCQSKPWGEHNCQHSEDAGVICADTKVQEISQSSKDCFSDSRSVPDNSPGQQLRLVGTDNRCSGRVEILSNNSWSTVCDDSWDMVDAHVVCRQLGCGPPQSAPGGGTFGQGEGVIRIDELKCKGSESFLSDCTSSPPGQHDCDHKEDASVICSEPGLSLTEDPSPGSERKTISIPVSVCIVLGVLFISGLVSLFAVTRRMSARREFATGRRGSRADLYEAIYEEIENNPYGQYFVHTTVSGSFPDSYDYAEPGETDNHGGNLLMLADNANGDLSKLECISRTRENAGIPVADIHRGDLSFDILAESNADRLRQTK